MNASVVISIDGVFLAYLKTLGIAMVVQLVLRIVAIGTVAIVCPHSARSCSPADEIAFEIEGDDVPEDFGERILKPLLASVESNRNRVLDVEMTALVSQPRLEKRWLREALSRSAVTAEDNLEYFIQVDKSPDLRTVEETQYEEKRESLEKAIATRQSLAEQKQSVEELLKMEPQIILAGGAFCYDGHEYTIIDFQRGTRFITDGSRARRVTGYVPYRIAPLLTASDIALSSLVAGDATIDSTISLYSKRPDRVGFFDHGSVLVSWKLADGLLIRRVLFDNAVGGLPVRLTDHWSGETETLLAETVSKWEPSDKGGFELCAIEANYRSPGSIKGRAHSRSVSLSLAFTWTEDRTSDFFSPQKVGTFLPFGGAKQEGGLE